MSRAATEGLTKITVSTDNRRVDVALPETTPVADLMPALLRSVGDGFADEGQRHGGWVLRRTDGDLIDADRSLSDQAVHDGELLLLVPAQRDWPEVDYDDVVDAIATSARKFSRTWTSGRTHLAGLAIAGFALAAGIPALLTTGPTWTLPAWVAIGVCLALLVAAAGFSRALADRGAAVTSGVFAMLYGALGGYLVLGGGQRLADFDPSQILAGSAVLFGVALVAASLAAQDIQYFTAGALIGLVGMLAALLARADNIDFVDAAAIALTVVVAFTPAFPILSIRLGKLPVPALPTSTDELLADPPQLPLERVQGTVRRSDEILTGLLLGGGILSMITCWILIGSGRFWAVSLAAVVAPALLLRARLFPATRHRLPLLVSGVVIVAMVGLAIVADLSADDRATFAVPAIVLVALALIALGRYFADHAPSPYLGRVADILDVLLILAVVPVMCAAVGLFGYLRGLYG